MLLIRSYLFIIIQWISTSFSFSFEGCGTKKSCWFQPPQCEAEQLNSCVSSVQWTVLNDGVLFELEATTSDLEPAQGYYIALGFSKDLRMGDDSVIECIFGNNDVSKAFVSFNDETHNYRLYQASSVMLNESSLTSENGSVKCAVKWLFDGREKVYPEDQFKVFDLESRLWHLLFARGEIDVYSLEKKIHSVNDGPAFPWISKQKLEFCRDNCSSDPIIIVTEMKQTDLNRYWRYRFAVIHGSFSLLAWWVLGSSAILIARYFKPLWPKKKLLGTAVWFQLHRNLNVAALIIQAAAVILIIYQAGRLYECSYTCSLEDWYKKMHVITGIGATGMILIQPFLAFSRPGPNSSFRPIFNWIHWFIGMLAWMLASVTILLSVALGKTGLMLSYGHVPTWIMAGYMLTFIVCSIILEILSSTSSRRADKFGPTEMSLNVLNGPTNEYPVAHQTYATARLFVFLVHLIISLGVSVTITVMLVKILLSHSP